MAELVTLARPYAKAAFEFARELKALDRWSNMLATAATVANAHTVKKLLASPNFTTDEKGQKFVDLCADEIDAKVANFIQYLADNQRLQLLPQVREQFELMKANYERTVDVDVITAFDISDAQKTKLQATLKQKLDREVNIQTSVDKSLIGGVLVRAGDFVVDGSVRGRLAKLAEAMGV
jgi:F-type H+-transporting ATPase subunit delta